LFSLNCLAATVIGNCYCTWPCLWAGANCCYL